MNAHAEIARREARRAIARRKVAILLDASRERPAPAPSRFSRAWTIGRDGTATPVAPSAFHVVKIAY